MEKNLPETEMKRLRDAGLLQTDEIAIKVGDLIVAENVVTRQRRLIEHVNETKAESRQLLKG